MDCDNIELMPEQYHILRVSRGLQRLESLGVSKTYPKNYIFDYREKKPDAMYLIKKGRVMVYEDSYNGEHRVYNIMRSGSLILEEYVLFPKSCPVLFKTLAESEIIKIERCELMRAFKNDIDIVLDILDSVCSKFVSAMETQRIGPRQDAEWKICRMIISDLENYGVPYKNGIILKEKVSHQMMADVLGLNRVTVTRKIKKLKELGLITRENGYNYVPDIEALLQYMDDLETQ